MDPQFVLLWVGFAAVSVVLSLTAGKPPLVSDDGQRSVVVYGRLVRRFSVAVSIFVLFSSIYAAQKPNVEQFDAIFFVISGITWGAYILCEVFRTRYEYDNETIFARTALSKKRAVPWEDVIDISYSHWMSHYVLHLRDDTKLRLSQYLKGGDAIMDFARKWKNFNNENAR